MQYKHTQIGHLMIAVTFLVVILFTNIYIMALNEPVSLDSGPNFAITSLMTLIVFTLASFSTLQVLIDAEYVHVKFGYGLYRKKFLLQDIVSAKAVKNHWYYGWGIRRWFWPNMWIFNVSGFDAVEILLKNGKRYRIGTDKPEQLEQAILKSIH